MPSRFTPAQIRGARAMLDWSMLDLARAAGVSVSTVKRIERGEGQAVSDDAREIVRVAVERAGVTLMDDEGNGAGIRLAMSSGSHL